MFKFIFGYDNDESSNFILPVAPESFKTKVGNKNSTIELISLGEFNIIKKIGLREFSFKILLPKNQLLSELSETEFHEPIFYLSKFREIKAAAKPIRFKITRILPDGSIIFPGNVLVSFENYSVEENAGEEGDYWVNIELKEYRSIETIITELTGKTDENGSQTATQEAQRTKKENAKTYIVQSGDSLWKIAKRELNNGSRYKEIAQLNNIQDPNRLTIGMVLQLP